MNKGAKMFRQGDVMVVEIDAVPADAKPVRRDAGRVVLAYGEVTGHAHAIREKGVALLELGAERYLRVEKGAELKHEEHSTISIPPGDYRVIQQREYDDAEEWRRVAD